MSKDVTRMDVPNTLGLVGADEENAQNKLNTEFLH